MSSITMLPETRTCNDELHVHYPADYQFAIQNNCEQLEVSGYNAEVKIEWIIDSVVNGVLNRTLSDSISKTFARLMSSIMKRFPSKSSKSKKMLSKENSSKENSSSSVCVLYQNDICLNHEGMTNADWEEGMIVSCQEINRSFRVRINPPVILDVTIFPKRTLLSNYRIVPVISSLFADEGSEEFYWYRQRPNSEDIELISTERIFIPRECDVGYTLTFICVPLKSIESSSTSIRYGKPSITQLPGVIMEGPVLGIFSCRQDFMSIPRINAFPTETDYESMRSGELRVVSYNILADCYVSTAFATNYLYSHVNSLYLELEYRCQLILQELVFYDADVIGLQECDEKSFDSYFRPILHSLGYKCHYSKKDGQKREGCAMFLKENVFPTAMFLTVPLKYCFKYASHLQDLYAVRPDIMDILCDKMSMVAEICVCISKDSRVVLISNTHLFYHPYAEYVRLLQTDMILRLLNDLKRALMIGVADDLLSEWVRDYQASVIRSYQTESFTWTNNDIKSMGMIFMGDLNATRETSPLELLVRGVIEPSHDVWNRTTQYRWDRSEEEDYNDFEISRDDQSVVKIISKIPQLHSDVQFFSAAGYPSFTNFVKGFKDTLDYVYAENRVFEGKRIAPFPSHDELAKDTSIPSEYYPSDHLAVAVDLKWNF